MSAFFVELMTVSLCIVGSPPPSPLNFENFKIENWNNEYIAQFIDTIHCQVSPLSYTSNIKAILP